MLLGQDPFESLVELGKVAFSVPVPQRAELTTPPPASPPVLGHGQHSHPGPQHEEEPNADQR